MSTIDPLDGEFAPYRILPTAEVKLTWVDNTTGVKQLAYGARLPSQRGYQKEHDHGQLGGVHLGMVLERYTWGPYYRSRGDLYSGIPICPPDPNDGNSFAGANVPKLLTSVPCRLIGGVTQVHIDLMLVAIVAAPPEDLTLGIVLRPTGFCNYNDFASSITEPNFTYGNLKKATLSLPLGASRQRFTFTDLSRLAPASKLRFAELCIFLMSDLPGAADIVHLTSATVSVAAVTTDISPQNSPANQEVTPSQVLAGKPLLSGLAEQAKARGNALNLSVIGARPGWMEGVLLTFSPFVQELTGAHQHQGKQIRQADGTFRGDGALLSYSLFSQGYPQLDETGSDYFDHNLPCTGIQVSRTGVIGEQLVFFQDIPLASGAKKIHFVFAMNPETASPKTRLAVAFHLCRSNVAPSAANNSIIAVNGVPTLDANGFVNATVEPLETPGFQWSTARVGLGRWTRDAQDAQAQPGVRLENSYRISQVVELQLRDVARITEQYTLRYAFLLYDDQTETSLDVGAGLVWANGIAVE